MSGLEVSVDSINLPGALSNEIPRELSLLVSSSSFYMGITSAVFHLVGTTLRLAL